MVMSSHDHPKMDSHLNERLATSGFRFTPQRQHVFNVLLEKRDHPTVVPEPALGSLSPRPEALGALDDTDPGSPHDYTLDSMPPTGGLHHDA